MLLPAHTLFKYLSKIKCQQFKTIMAIFDWILYINLVISLVFIIVYVHRVLKYGIKLFNNQSKCQSQSQTIAIAICKL